MAVVYIGLGSNLGNRQENINKAVRYLESEKSIKVEVVSSIIETEPVGPFGPDYLNGVIKVITGLSPKALLDVLQLIETKMGRIRTFKNAPRTIDLDILLYDDVIINSSELQIPHPQIFERKFVAKSLLEIDLRLAKTIERLRKMTSQ